MILKEGHAEINEINNLALDVISYFAKNNIELVKDFSEGLDSVQLKTRKIKLKQTIYDIEKYPLLNNFINEFPIEIEMIKGLKSVGSWFSYEGNGGAIALKFYEEDFKSDLEMFVRDYKLKTNFTYEIAHEILTELFMDMKRALVHELQHAFDDYRSNGKYDTDKKSKRYYKTDTYDFFADDTEDPKDILLYYKLPHEYWARFSDFVTRRFTDYQKPFNIVFDNFKLWFKGYSILPENDKIRLQKALYKYWSEENKQMRENIIESKVVGDKEIHNRLVSLVKQYNQIPNSHTNKKYDLYRQILNKVKHLNYSLSNVKDGLVVLNNDKPIRTIANRTEVEEIQQHMLLVDYPSDFQMFVNKLIGVGHLAIHNIDANANLDVAQKDILNNKKSVSANNTLDSLEGMFERGVIRVKASKHTPAFSIPINEYFGIFDNNQINDEDDFWDAFFSKLEENKNKKNMNNLESLIESIVRPLLEGKSFDYMKAIKKADRELEYELSGPGWKAKDKAHKDKTKYDRKRDKKTSIDEEIEFMDEATYSFDSEDPNLQQKTDKLKNDTTLFNKDNDEIKINTESVGLNEYNAYEKRPGSIGVHVGGESRISGASLTFDENRLSAFFTEIKDKEKVVRLKSQGIPTTTSLFSDNSHIMKTVYNLISRFGSRIHFESLNNGTYITCSLDNGAEKTRLNPNCNFGVGYNCSKEAITKRIENDRDSGQKVRDNAFEDKKIVLTKNQILEMNQLRQLNKKNIFTKNQIIEMLKKKDNL